MRIAPTTKYLLIANIAAFTLTALLPGLNLNDVFGLHFLFAPDFRFYQFLTYIFMHANFQHIFFNMFALWMFGSTIEDVWGGKKFLFYYIACGMGAGLFQEIAQFVHFYIIASNSIPDFTWSLLPQALSANGSILNGWTTVGASGAIYGILLAFCMLFPEQKIFIFPLPIPIKPKVLIIFYFVLELSLALFAQGDGVAHIAHTGGMVIGFFIIRYWRKHSGYGGQRYEGNIFKNFTRKFRNNRDNGTNRRWHGNNGNSEAVNNHQSDWDYNANQKARQDEIDKILDKIRKAGYDSLTREEKQKLFDYSNNK